MRKRLINLLITLFVIFPLYGQIIDLGNEIKVLIPSQNGVYCPNTLDDFVGPGGLDFNGRVKFTQSNRWWIDITNSETILYLDIQFSFTSVNNPSVFVRGSRRFKVFGVSDLKTSIVGFRQEGAITNSFSDWVRNSYGYISLDMNGDGGIFCDDDNDKDISAFVSGGRNDIKFFVDIQGDTGGSDISDDRNCSCDARVLKLWWNKKIQVAVATDIDHDGLQDSNIYQGLPVDRDVKNNNKTKRILYVNVTNLKTPEHDNDCTRIQGNISLNLFVEHNGPRKLVKASGTSKLVDWEGNKNTDFDKRNLSQLPLNTVSFVIEEEALRKGSYFFEVVNSIRRCHKKCGLCSGYNCAIRYYHGDIDGVPITVPGVYYVSSFQLESYDRRSYNYAGHDMIFDISLTAR